MSHVYNIIIDRDVGEPGNGRGIYDGLNATDKRFLLMLTTNVQLTGAADYYSQIEIHTSTTNPDTSLER